MFKRKGIDYIILFFILLAGMWQLAFLQASMKWDIMDITLPWNYYLSECLENGILPLWNPFINGGFAQYGIHETWYPINWIISLLFGYDVVVIQYNYLLHLFIGGLGSYHLGNHFGWQRTTKILIATAYMFSGLMIGNAQHLGWVVSAAWLPLVFLFYKKLEKNPSLVTAICLALFASLMLSGGYPGIFVPTAYIIFFLFLYRFFSLIKNKDVLLFKKIMSYTLVSLCVFTLLSFIVIIGTFDLSSYINRGSALATEKALVGSLPWEAIITFLFPYSSTSSITIWGTDWSLVNCYFGLLPFLSLLFIFFYKKIDSRILKYSLTGLFFLMLAIAEFFPFRKWINEVLPLMRMFRFPTIMRLFSIFFFLIASGFALEHFSKNIFQKKKNKIFSKKTFLFGLSSILFFGLIIILSFLFGKNESHRIWSNIRIQSIIHIILLSSLVLSFYFLKPVHQIGGNEKNLKTIFLLIGILDILVAVQLNIHSTVIHNHNPKITTQAIKDIQGGFPIPNIENPFATLNQIDKNKLSPLHVNLNHFYKIPNPDGNSPLSFHWTNTAIKNGTYQNTIQNPILFFAKDLSTSMVEINQESKIEEKSIDHFSHKKIQIENFHPNEWKIKTSAIEETHLIFLQNYHPDWKVYLNDIEKEIIQTNKTFMSVKINPGNNDVRFSFEPKKVIRAFYVSLLSWILVSLFLLKIGIGKTRIFFSES